MLFGTPSFQFFVIVFLYLYIYISDPFLTNASPESSKVKPSNAIVVFRFQLYVIIFILNMLIHNV